MSKTLPASRRWLILGPALALALVGLALAVSTWWAPARHNFPRRPFRKRLICVESALLF